MWIIGCGAGTVPGDCWGGGRGGSSPRRRLHAELHAAGEALLRILDLVTEHCDVLVTLPTGGGKSLIAAFEDEASDKHTTDNFQVYGLTLDHKHAPEIHKYTGLKHRPLFVPSVGRYAQGMIVQIPLQLWAIPSQPKPSEIHAVLADYYAGRQFVTVVSLEETSMINRLQPEALKNTNELQLHVFGNVCWTIWGKARPAWLCRT